MADPDVQTLINAVNARLNAIEAQREALGAERLLLLRTRAHYESQAGDQSSARALHNTPHNKQTTPPSAPATFADMGITEAVRSYIQRFPGHTAPQVTDALQPVVKTNAKDVRKTLSWTITDLIRRKYAVRRSDGKLYPTYQAQEIQGQGELIEGR